MGLDKAESFKFPRAEKQRVGEGLPSLLNAAERQLKEARVSQERCFL